MGALFQVNRIFAFLIIASGCGQALPDQSVCAEIESKAISAGGKVTLTWRIARTSSTSSTSTMSGTGSTGSTGSTSPTLLPYRSIPVTVTQIGGRPHDASYDLRVCAPDCAAAPDSAFVESTKTVTSESGILIYSVLSGAKSTGTVLIDFGSVSCLQPVEPGATGAL